MRYLKLPRFEAQPERPSRRPLPVELRWDAPPSSVVSHLSRRQFLKAFTVALAAFAAPWSRLQTTWAAARGRYFTGHERATLTALMDRIIPPDQDPGAKTLGAPVYLEKLLTAFDYPVPRLFAGGPFSNRNPYPNPDTGEPTHRRPRNAFKQFIAPTYLQELHWRAELFGSATVPEAAALDAQFGSRLIGLRDLYRTGLKKVDDVAVAAFGKPFSKLVASQQDDVLDMLDAGAFAPDPRRDGKTFMDIVIGHTLEGCFAAPEYGGNRKVRGWRMVGVEGDSQPLGYSLFAGATSTYGERTDHPLSSPNPDELQGTTVVAKPLSADGQKIQNSIVFLTNGIFGTAGNC